MIRFFSYCTAISSLIFVLMCVDFGVAVAEPIPQSAVQREAYDLAKSGNYIKAREAAEKLRREDKDDFWALVTLAHVFQEGEGNLPRARYLMNRAMKVAKKYENDDGTPSKTLTPFAIHQCELLAEIDDREAQLACLEDAEERFKLDLKFRHIWPLIKLKRYQEARKLIEELSSDPGNHGYQSALNSLIALEEALCHYTESYEQGVRVQKLTNEQSCVIASNVCTAALQTFHLNEV